MLCRYFFVFLQKLAQKGKKIPLSIILICASFHSFSQPITRHALLVGIGSYQNQSGWPGLHSDQDALKMQTLLKQKGFLDRNIHLLTNESATLENIRLALKRLLNETEPEDQIILYFSGHSQQITDVSGDEEDGWDESFVCEQAKSRFKKDDYEGQSHLLDDELSRWVNRFAEKVTRNGSVFFFYDGGISQVAKKNSLAKGPFPPFQIPEVSKIGKERSNYQRFDNEWFDFSFDQNHPQIICLDPGFQSGCPVIEIEFSKGKWGSPLVDGFVKFTTSEPRPRFRDLRNTYQSIVVPGSKCNPNLDGALHLEIFESEKERKTGELESEPLEKQTGQIYSISIGVSKYQNIDPLQFGHQDALLFFTSLNNAFPQQAKPENQYLFIDSTATIKPIIQALEEISANVTEGDKVYFFFAGHGDVENLLTRKAHLLLFNSPSHVYKAGGTLPVEDVKDYLSQWLYKKARVFLVVDACKSGRLAGGLPGQGATSATLTEMDKLSVRMLSCQPNERSVESEVFGGGHGAFTYFLVNGLTGQANLDNDNRISVSEIGRFLADSVPKATNQSQNPLIIGNKNVPFFPVLIRSNLVVDAKKIRQKTKITWLDSQSDDSLKGRWINEFRRHLASGNIIQPELACAKASYNLLTNTFPLDTRLQSELVQDLQNAIDKKSQALINEYIKGNEQLSDEGYFALSARELNYLVEMMDVIDPLYFMYLSRKYFFEGRSIKPRLVNNDLNRHKLATAIRNLQKSLKYEPEAAQNYNAIGRLRQVNRQFEEAIQAYKKAMVLTPSWKFPVNNLATVYNEMAAIKKSPKYLDSAVFFYFKALEIDPTFGVAHKNLGKTFVDQGKTELAKKQYLKAIFFKPEFIDSYQNLGDLYRLEAKWDSATYYLRLGLSLKPDHPDLLTNLGNVHFDQIASEEGQKKELLEMAKKFYKKAIASDSNCVDAQLGLGNVFWESNSYDSSLIFYKVCSQLDTLNLTFKNYLMEAYLKTGNLQKAKVLGQKIATGFPDDPTNWFDLGVLAVLEKNEKLAESHFLKAISFGIDTRAAFETEELLTAFIKSQTYKRLILRLK